MVRSGMVTFVDGFVPDAKAGRMRYEQDMLVRQAVRNPEHCFDELCAQGRMAEAAWLVEHLGQLQLMFVAVGAVTNITTFLHLTIKYGGAYAF